jgi:hypothetical protein
VFLAVFLLLSWLTRNMIGSLVWQQSLAPLKRSG